MTFNHEITHDQLIQLPAIQATDKSNSKLQKLINHIYNGDNNYIRMSQLLDGFFEQNYAFMNAHKGSHSILNVDPQVPIFTCMGATDFLLRSLSSKFSSKILTFANINWRHASSYFMSKNKNLAKKTIGIIDSYERFVDGINYRDIYGFQESDYTVSPRIKDININNINSQLRYSIINNSTKPFNIILCPYTANSKVHNPKFIISSGDTPFEARQSVESKYISYLSSGADEYWKTTEVRPVYLVSAEYFGTVAAARQFFGRTKPDIENNSSNKPNKLGNYYLDFTKLKK